MNVEQWSKMQKCKNLGLPEKTKEGNIPEESKRLLQLINVYKK